MKNAVSGRAKTDFPALYNELEGRWRALDEHKKNMKTFLHHCPRGRDGAAGKILFWNSYPKKRCLPTERVHKPSEIMTASALVSSEKASGDGDTKTINALSENKPYGDDYLIQKNRMCRPCAKKRMGTRLMKLKLVYSKKELSDGKTIGGKGRLTDSLIDKLAHYYGNAIRCNSTSVKEMRKAIWAVWGHSCSTDDEPIHWFCPTNPNTWYSGLTAIETKLGWTVIGKVSSNVETAMLTTSSLHVWNVSVKELWELDVLGITDPLLNENTKENFDLTNFFFKNKMKILPDGGGVRLVNSTLKALNMPDLKVTLWSDSTTAPWWIKEYGNWSVFVANRVKDFRQLTQIQSWKYVPGNRNIADLLPRSCSPRQMFSHLMMVSPSIVPSGNFTELIRTVTCIVVKPNDRRTSSPRSDYVRQVALETTT
ncbi:uncharacterized protein TNCV_270161 [Trichonephila clavipes]|nr:uncharacterized protein TNCV_270161 [Trichonephila clavipes]